MTVRPSHYYSQYNRDQDELNRQDNQRKYKAEQEKIWLAKMDEIYDLLGDDAYDQFYDSLPDNAPTQTYIDICNTKLAELTVAQECQA